VCVCCSSLLFCAYLPLFCELNPARSTLAPDSPCPTRTDMARSDAKDKAPVDAEAPAAPDALEVSTAAGVDGSAAGGVAASPFGLASRADYRRAASVPLGWSCLMTNQVMLEGGACFLVRAGRAWVVLLRPRTKLQPPPPPPTHPRSPAAEHGCG